jgi:hypothetical protein
MLLAALALSHDDLLAILCQSRVLQRIELSLHSCKVLAAQNATWLPAWHAVHDLHQILTYLSPLGPILVKPYSEEHALHIWRNIGYGVTTLHQLFK